MVRIKDGYYETRHDEINKILDERVWFKHIGITHATTSSRASKGIATMLKHDVDVYDMHDCDNRKSAIRDLIRTRNKT